MSSEISIDAPARLPSTGLGAGKTAATDVAVSDAAVESGFGRTGAKADDGFRPWHFFVLSSILLATAGVMLARQSSPESLIIISLTIGAAGFAAAAFYRMLAPLTQPFVLRMGEPVSDRTRAALEREKMLVLRTIKELEFDRSMGKLSQKDFDEMATRLRARAVSLIKQLDLGTGAYASVIEQEVASRIAQRQQKKRQKLPASPVKAQTCACGTVNDVDAAFCKKCGARLTR